MKFSAGRFRMSRVAHRRQAHTACCGVLLATTLAACGRSGWFTAGPRPRDLVGVWVDSSLATSTDTIAWVLGENGIDRTLHITVSRDATGRASVDRRTTTYGLWYVSGDMRDAEKRTFCVKRRPRDGATCVSFRLDTVASTQIQGVRRRLFLLGYKGQVHQRDRILLERLQ